MIYDPVSFVFVAHSSEQVSVKTYHITSHLLIALLLFETFPFRCIDSLSYVTREKAFEEGLAFWTEDGIPGIQVRPYALFLIVC
jgi:hypothetical protein